MGRRLVLGIGNILMGDEGVGVHAIEYLQGDTWPPDVQLVDGGTGGFHLLDYLSSNEPLVMIDATLDGKPPGTVSVLRPRYASDFPRALSAHDIGLRDLVEAAQLTGALPDVHLITVSIDEIRPMHLSLSAPVAAALPAVRDAVHAALAAPQALLPAPPVALASWRPGEAARRA
ncbi:MAG: hydrogenase maturation protease [Vicinamibacterales bacterium]